MVGQRLQEINRCKVNKRASVDRLETGSMCAAFVHRQMKRHIYDLKIVDFLSYAHLVMIGPAKSTSALSKVRQGLNLETDKSPIM